MMGLLSDIKTAVKVLLEANNNSSTINATCEIFKRYVSRTWVEIQDFAQLKARLINRGEKFKRNILGSRDKVAQVSVSFITDGMVGIEVLVNVVGYINPWV
jgi:translation initiation factor eIF-2B subunit alpha